MIRAQCLAGMAAIMTTIAAPAAAASITDPQIAHIAYTAGQIDVEAAKLALSRSRNKAVLDFAREMVRDHEAVNQQALALVRKLGVTPEANPTSSALQQGATAKASQLSALKGAAFDRAYAANEVAYHRTVNSALRDTLIPSAANGELKSLLATGLTLFTEHQHHAEHLAASLR